VQQQQPELERQQVPPPFSAVVVQEHETSAPEELSWKWVLEEEP